MSSLSEFCKMFIVFLSLSKKIATACLDVRKMLLRNMRDSIPLSECAISNWWIEHTRHNLYLLDFRIFRITTPQDNKTIRGLLCDLFRKYSILNSIISVLIDKLSFSSKNIRRNNNVGSVCNIDDIVLDFDDLMGEKTTKLITKVNRLLRQFSQSVWIHKS